MRTINIGAIRDGDHVELKADEGERGKIAQRLGLLSLDRFEANAALVKDDGKVSATGRVIAKVQQACVATGEPVINSIDEPFSILFLPEPDIEAEEEIELNEDQMDVVFHDGATIALGDAVTDTLALALDPYPRSAEAEAHLKEAGVLSEEEAGPFGALADLKRKMEGDG